MQNRFRMDCQKVFNAQLNLLAVTKKLPESIGDEENEKADENLLAELGKDIENMLNSDDDDEEQTGDKTGEEARTQITQTKSMDESMMTNFVISFSMS